MIDDRSQILHQVLPEVQKEKKKEEKNEIEVKQYESTTDTCFNLDLDQLHLGLREMDVRGNINFDDIDSWALDGPEPIGEITVNVQQPTYRTSPSYIVMFDFLR